MELALIGNSFLRNAIRENLVSFPSQLPAFTKRGGVQERMVQLYFVRGWPMKIIAERYGLTKSGVRKLISDWRVRAVAAGYIQDIRPESFAAPGYEDLSQVDDFELSSAGSVHSDPAWDALSAR